MKSGAYIVVWGTRSGGDGWHPFPFPVEYPDADAARKAAVEMYTATLEDDDVYTASIASTIMSTDY